ncbi:MAG: CARDB domain-containing protein [Candidatus Thalassarchaeaceae archaeon]
MRGAGGKAILLSFLLFSSISVTILNMDNYSLENNLQYETGTSSGSAIIDVQSWQINDNWMYDGYLDVGDFIASSGVSTNIESLYGTLEKTVTEIYISEIDNRSSLTYKLESVGTYGANNVNLDGQNGDITVEMLTIEIIRASDMAVFSQSATVDIDFCADVLWFCIDIDVAELNVTNSYSPALEGLDFPLSVGETWNADYHQETEYSGESNYVDIPEDSEDDNSSSWSVVSQGFSGVSYSGCSQSYNITTYNSDGEESGYRWYCPAIKGDIKSSFIESIGFVAVHELTAYQPSTRSKVIEIDIEYPLSPIDTEISAWINVTNQGSPVANQTMDFRYEIEDDVRQIITDENGTCHLEFNTGNTSDNSESNSDYASHGLISWIPGNNIIGVSSLSMDLNVHEVDLVARNEGVTVERTRDNNTITLDPSVGFNAISGDSLVFSVPVVNRGLISSPPTQLRVDSPDGNTAFTYVPSLNSLEESRVELNWTVPELQSYGPTYLEFLVDPEENISEDGNRSNNQGSFSLYVGALPMAILSSPNEINTLEDIVISGLSSIEPDGGDFVCEFEIESMGGSFNSILEEDCELEWSWNDDGNFSISLVITDEENDQSSAQSSIIVLNRPPEITLTSDHESIPVLSEVTFEITEWNDPDTQNPNSPIDILWNDTSCKEGRIGLKCTITPTSEGEFSIGVSATDDDGETVFASHSIEVTNIAPYDGKIEVFSGSQKITADNRGVFAADEGEILTIRGWASDSVNDINSLQFSWMPDAENNPDISYYHEGSESIINHSYNYTGLQLATLQIIDDDGAPLIFDNGQEVLIIPIEISNINPSIVSLNQRLPVEEGEELIFDVGVSDSLNDIASLYSCFDIDPSLDSDSSGLSDDDCDFNSNYMSYTWEDASKVPEYIIFHVSDDDNASASIEIEIDVRNVRPTAVAEPDSINPVQGNFISLSANGTIDSEHDIENMIYHWDIDISVDSDNDGDPANDVDMQGRWVQVIYDTEGMKNVKLTVYDESESNSVYMVVDVAKAPFDFKTSFKENSASILLIILIGVAGIVLAQRYRESKVVESEKEEVPISIDQLFDDSELKTSKEEKIGNEVKEETESMPSESLNQINFDKLEEDKIAINEILSDEDIEALFEE